MKHPRATCRGCGRAMAVSDGGNGTIRPHGPVGDRCPGSREEPAEHLRLGRDYSVADVFRAIGEPVPAVWAALEANHEGSTP